MGRVVANEGPADGEAEDRTMNRLADETSPYLRQHRDNPVDWYPWGEEAFARAREQDLPILLSVGYSACHWCHVMAHESFEDPGTAAIMNRLFVNVKVDREERPDVDAVYMEAVQALHGSGGWPMTVFLTPDRRPFFAGTYFPPRGRGGSAGFPQVLEAVADAWEHRRDEVVDQAGQLADAIRARTELPAGGPGHALDSTLLEQAYAGLRAAHDDEQGGFGRAPKFPQPAMVDFVVRAAARNRSPETLAMLATTLDAMASGGMYDHLGGGFARYSVDAFWMVPHFEKMLYDQAGLLRVYLHAWQLTGEPRWSQVAGEIVGYVLRDLRGAEGGLCSAEDADSEGEEGRFYLWSMDEIETVLGADLAAEAGEWYGVTATGNFEGRNILHRPRRGDLIRPARVEEARERLFRHRLARVRPGLDDKVITEWNAMLLASLAEAAGALARPDWQDAAVALGEFLLAELRRPDDGRWLRSWQGGRARHLAYAADYAWLVDAFTRLAELTGSRRWLEEASTVADQMVSLFWDEERGGLFTTGFDGEQLIVRTKDLFDGAIPSANSVAAVALLRLGALTGSARFGERAEAILAMLAEPLAHSPTAFAHVLAAVDLLLTGATEVVVAGDRPDLVAAARRHFLPNGVVAWGEPWPSPLWEGRAPGRAYVCRNYSCLLPATTVEELETQLRQADGQDG